MDRKTCLWMIGEAKKLHTALRETMEQITAEAAKPCRCTPEEREAVDPCPPCLAREALAP